MIVVVDASAIAAIGFEEPERSVVLDLVRHQELHAPPLIEIEVCNIYLRTIRRRPKSATELRRCVQMFFSVPILIRRPETLSALDLAESFGLDCYDACDRELAQQTGSQLVTLDKRLATVAAALTVSPECITPRLVTGASSHVTPPPARSAAASSISGLDCVRRASHRGGDAARDRARP